jgi:hypothetical protein
MRVIVGRGDGRVQGKFRRPARGGFSLSLLAITARPEYPRRHVAHNPEVNVAMNHPNPKSTLTILGEIVCTTTWVVCLTWTVIQLPRSWGGRGFEMDIAVATNIVGGYAIARAITRIIPALLGRPGSTRA